MSTQPAAKPHITIKPISKYFEEDEIKDIQTWINAKSSLPYFPATDIRKIGAVLDVAIELGYIFKVEGQMTLGTDVMTKILWEIADGLTNYCSSCSTKMIINDSNPEGCKKVAEKIIQELQNLKK